MAKKTGKKGKKALNVKSKPTKRIIAKKPADPVLSAMGRELSKNTRPQMFETDRTAEKSKLVKLDEADDDAMKSYYKNLQLRCVKCDGSFQHKADLPLVEYEIKCPHCSESHILKFKPTSRLFTMQSSSVELLGQKEK